MGIRIVVTGIGIVSPIGLSADTTWESLLAGKSGVDYISSFDSEPFETRIAAEVKEFEPTDFLDRKEARRMDRFVQFATVASQEAVAKARLNLDKEEAEKVSFAYYANTDLVILSHQQNWSLIHRKRY